MRFLYKLYKILSSYWLAAVTLFFMTVVTLVGTLDQVDLGLWEAKQRYFHSFFTSYKGIPLPGGLLLMMLLFVNMVFGGMVHVRKKWRGLPLLISHFGMLFLLVSGFVTWTQTRDGFVAVYAGQVSDRAQSYRDWQIEILEVNEEGQATKAHTIPTEVLAKLGPTDSRKCMSDALPFSLTIDRWFENAAVLPTSAPLAADLPGKVIDGFKVKAEKGAKERSRNFPACYLTIRPESGEASEVILWGLSAKYDPRSSTSAYTFEVAGRQWALQLVKKSWPIAFAIRLDRFLYEKHPGTMTPKNFESRITRLDSLDAAEGKRVAIQMNKPMRHDGFVVFQESYGTRDKGPDPEYYSQFAVSDNPADQWPLYALIVTGVGLTLHFIMKLVGFKGAAERNRRQRREASANLDSASTS
ncbi:cytochrome c biogenesis protein ResB [bacterium]|jgi:hypothetical protein|nr:cytochrome c biogenesis protein ResB [bacterium]